MRKQQKIRLYLCLLFQLFLFRGCLSEHKRIGFYTTLFCPTFQRRVTSAFQTKKIPVHLLVMYRGSQVRVAVKETFCRTVSNCVSGTVPPPLPPEIVTFCILHREPMEGCMIWHTVWLGMLLSVRDTPPYIYCHQYVSFVGKNQENEYKDKMLLWENQLRIICERDVLVTIISMLPLGKIAPNFNNFHTLNSQLSNTAFGDSRV